MPGKKRRYLPRGLTAAEKKSPGVRAKLSRCIKAVEEKSCPSSAKAKGKYDYKKCRYNPVSVCRNSILGRRK